MKNTIDKKQETRAGEAINLGRYIATCRKLREMTQQDLARKAGMDNTYLSRLEKGQIDKPRLETLRKIARALGVAEEVLIVFVAPEKVKDAERVRPGAKYDPNDTYVPDFLLEIAAAERGAEKPGDDDREIDELIEKAMVLMFKKMIKDGGLVKASRGIIRDTIEKKVKKELLSKAG